MDERDERFKKYLIRNNFIGNICNEPKLELLKRADKHIKEFFNIFMDVIYSREHLYKSKHLKKYGIEFIHPEDINDYNLERNDNYQLDMFFKACSINMVKHSRFLLNEDSNISENGFTTFMEQDKTQIIRKLQFLQMDYMEILKRIL